MNNQDIRKAIQDKGLKYWQVADKYGVNDGNFSRLLRKELSSEVKRKVFKAIKEAEREWLKEVN